MRVSDKQLYFSLERGSYKILEKTKKYQLNEKDVLATVEQTNANTLKEFNEYIGFISDNFSKIRESKVFKEAKTSDKLNHVFPKILFDNWKYGFINTNAHYGMIHNTPAQLFLMLLKWDDQKAQEMIFRGLESVAMVDRSRW